jgi:DNA adenine methylase
MSDLRAAPIRPILKWAGGKRQLLPELRPFYPRVFSRYVEPFLGSGAVFLDLFNAGLLDGRRVALSDINADIIGCYLMVRDRPAAVIAALRALEGRHRRRGDAHFYDVRDNAFNPTRRLVHAASDPAASYTPALAAMLIYLNRTGFNGLFRVNGRGDFNVPAGRYARPLICDEANLHAWSAALNRPDLTIGVATFERALETVGQDDFVYLDPPYAPVSATARFTGYTAGGFGAAQQAALQRMVIAMAANGASVLLSNSAAPQIRALYARDRHAKTAGLTAKTVSARRAINSRAASRGAVQEYLITNVARRSV